MGRIRIGLPPAEGFGMGCDDIDENESSFVLVEGFADLIFLKKGDAGVHGVEWRNPVLW